MAIDLSSAKPLSLSGNSNFLETQGVEQLFRDTQCNVLAPHNCLYSYHLFIKFPSNREEARAYVHARTVGEFRVTSHAARRGAELERYRAYVAFYQAKQLYQQNKTAWFRRLFGFAPSPDELPAPPGPANRPVVRSFMLSRNGLLALLRKGEKRPMSDDTTFLADVPAVERLFLGWPSGNPTASWDPPFNRSDLHAHLLLAGDNLADLAREVNREIRELEQVYHGEKIGGEFGYRKRIGPPGSQQDIEHFGYADGISNPQFLDSDLGKEEFLNTDPAVLREQHFYPRSNLLFELPDRRGTYGSYHVFRKIEQDVDAFANVADPDQKVGRRKDGTPLVPTRSADLNDFDYDDDPPAPAKVAPRCPFHAHIRKANPRTTGDATLRQQHREVLFVRRGILYGRKQLDLATGTVAEDPTEPVGLLFMGYMGSIEKQFHHMQRFWFPIPTFPHPDPALGDKNQDLLVSLPPVADPPLTTVMGSCFFFVPPISWMENLSYSWP